MNKRRAAIVGGAILFLVLLLSLFSKTKLEIDKTMNEYLSEIGITNYRVYNVSDYKEITYTDIKREVTDSDIKEFIQNDLEAREETVPVKDRGYVKNGDVVSVTYSVYLDGQQVNYIENESFMVGKGKYNLQIENNIVGKEINQEITFNIQVPKDDQNEAFAGKIETVKLRVNSIHIVKKCELNEYFVAKYYDFGTVDEYYEYVKNKIEKDNEMICNSLEYDEIMSKVIDCFEIELSEEEIAKYSLSIVDEYIQQAYICNQTIDEYVEKTLHMTEEEFMNKCYNEGRNRIKNFIAIGVVAKKENISVALINDSIEGKINQLVEDTVSYLKSDCLIARKEKE